MQRHAFPHGQASAEGVDQDVIGACSPRLGCLDGATPVHVQYGACWSAYRNLSSQDVVLISTVLVTDRDCEGYSPAIIHNNLYALTFPAYQSCQRVIYITCSRCAPLFPRSFTPILLL